MARSTLLRRRSGIRRESLELARARWQGGLTSELDVQQGENALAVAEGTLSRVAPAADPEGKRAQCAVGSPAGDLPRGLPLTQQQFPNVIPAGLPSQLLEAAPRREAG
jgi:outer membrane protein TolC